MGFLRSSYEENGLDLKWINWVMKCITTFQYALIVNGNLVGCIKPSRRIRQEDPLSPYLFLSVRKFLVSS